MTRIVHVIGALIAGGAERFVAQLAMGLQQAGEQVHLLCLSNRTDAATAGLRSCLDSAHVDVSIGPTAVLGVRTMLWYVRRVTALAPQIIHLHTPNTELTQYLTGPLTAPSIAIVRTVHNTEWPQGRLIHRAYKRNRARISIACGASVSQAMGALIEGPSTVIRNGVSFADLATPEQRAATRAKLGLAQGRHYLAIGRIDSSELTSLQKGQDLLVRAWIDGRLGSQGAVLHLLGDGSLRGLLERTAAADPSIRFHGIVGNVDEWLRSADVFVMPSRFEGLPIAGIEAVGAGLPCIFSDIPPLRELQPPCVLWARANDAASLQAQLLEFSQRPAIPAREATQQFRDRFSIARTVEQYRHAYSGL